MRLAAGGAPVAVKRRALILFQRSLCFRNPQAFVTNPRRFPMSFMRSLQSKEGLPYVEVISVRYLVSALELLSRFSWNSVWEPFIKSCRILPILRHVYPKWNLFYVRSSVDFSMYPLKPFHIFCWNSIREIFNRTCQEIPSFSYFFIYSGLEEAVLLTRWSRRREGAIWHRYTTVSLARESYNSVWWGSIEDVTVLWHNADICVQDVLK
jgi:hypothetical protein